jgi:hypothetical protein
MDENTVMPENAYSAHFVPIWAYKNIPLVKHHDSMSKLTQHKGHI